MTRTEAIAELLWDYLKADREHKDRRQTGWGTKTKAGLVASLDRIYIEKPLTEAELKS
jgi:hypothetical protein